MSDTKKKAVKPFMVAGDLAFYKLGPWVLTLKFVPKVQR